MIIYSLPPCDTIFATVVPGIHGEVATLYWVVSKHLGSPLTLAECSVVQFLPTIWGMIDDKVSIHAGRRIVRYGIAGIHIEGEFLTRQAYIAGINAIQIKEHLTVADYWNTLGLAAAFYIRGKSVKIDRGVDLALLKSALNYTGGPRGDDPVTPAFLYGVVMALDPAAAIEPDKLHEAS